MKKLIGLDTLLFLIFLVLKLAQVGVVADWSWWWVTAPIWLTWSIVIVIVVIIAIIKALIKK